MHILSDIAKLKRHLRALQQDGLRIGLVPTMGALHDGHLSLVQLAKRHADLVVASIFVNPTQFGPNEDLSRYPRDLDGDAKKLAAAGCDLVFAPETQAMYPAGFETEVKVTKTSTGLCGDVRPGHFQGVATVVLKLFHIVRPDIAVFGEKDYQQLSVIRALVRDLSLDVEILGAPLVRDPDGLAMSSRNAFLSREDRRRALSLSRGLRKAQAAYAAGEKAGAILLEAARQEMALESIAPEYLELRSATDLKPLDRADGPAIILTAARVGSTRLIDNLILRRP
jgi:pantoate--beta-alanine ligase